MGTVIVNEFGSYLKSLLRIYRIRNVDVANALGKTSPFISHFFVGRAEPNREQYDKILELLKRNNIKRAEEDQLNKLFIMLKTGIGARHTGIPLEEINDVMEAVLMSRWRSLFPDQQKHIIDIIEEFILANARNENR